MSKKMVILNNYHKKLSFESLLGRPFAMEGKEIRTVDYDVGIRLLQNVWVERLDGKERIKEEQPKLIKKIPIKEISRVIPKIVPIVKNEKTIDKTIIDKKLKGRSEKIRK